MKLDKKGLTAVAMQAAGVTGGEVAASFSDKLLDKVPFLSNAYAKAGVKVLGGLLLANKMGKKNELLKGVGVGIAVAGLRGAINQFSPGLISGPFDPYPNVTGMPMYAVDAIKVSGPFSNMNASLSGTPDSASGTFAEGTSSGNF